MLRHRIITALILAPLVLLGVLLAPNGYLGVLFALIVLFGGYEWARLSGVDGTLGQWAYLLVLGLCLFGLWLIPQKPGLMLTIMACSALWWLITFFRLLRFDPEQRMVGLSFWQLTEGLIVLSISWYALLEIHRLPDGPYLVVFLLILIWLADIGAYFAGHAWGKTKLAPKVSPGKTREGLYGALVAAIICGGILAWWRADGAATGLGAIALCLLTVLFSVLGDLFESTLKRQRGFKDSGNLLPGHGGVLDRIDSLTAASPIFMLGLLVWMKIA